MLSKKTKISAGIVAAVIALFLVGFVFRFDRLGFIEIDYVDCVYINNQLYFSGYSPYDRTPVESSLVDKKIGKVQFKLSESVHSTYYINRNGDAAFLDVGTEIYILKSGSNAVAAKIGDQYYIYKKSPD